MLLALSLIPAIAATVLAAPPRPSDPCLRVNARTTEVLCTAHEADRSPEPLDLGALTVARKLESITITGYPLLSLEPLRALPQVTRVVLHDNGKVDLAPLSALVNVHHLSLAGHDLGSLAFLSNMKAVRWLELREGRASSLEALAGLARLESLVIKDMTGAPVRKLANPNLGFLDLQRVGLTDLTFLADLPRLTRLALTEPRLRSLAGLERVPSLTTLDLTGMQDLVDVGALTRLSGLKNLQIAGAPSADLRPLRSLRNLETLEIRDGQLGDLAWLESSPGLISLTLVNTKVADITVLARLTGLRSVQLTNTQVADLGPLSQLPALDTLIVKGSPAASPASIKAFKQSRPKRAPALTLYTE